MASDPIALRRRAAVAVLGGVLDDAMLSEALQLQGRLMSGDGVSDVIAFIDHVAQRQMIDAAGCKRLYAALFSALRQAEDTLPPDPWQARHSIAPSFLPNAPLLAVAVPASPVAAASPPLPASVPDASMRPPQLAGQNAVESDTRSRPGEGPVVFAAILRALVREINDSHAVALVEISRDATREVQRSDISADLRQRFSEAWLSPLSDDWKLPGLTLELAELVRVAFVALVQSFGRIGADQILTRAIQTAERLPEARKFSPKRLLSAL